MQDAPHICFTFVGDVTRDSRLRRFRQAASDLATVSLVTLSVSASEGDVERSDGTGVTRQPSTELNPTSRHFHLERFGRQLRFRPLAPAMLRSLLPRFWREGARAAALLDADLYVAADLYALPAAAGAARRTGRPVIYDARELYRAVAALSHRPLMQRFWRLLERRYARAARAVLTVNDSIADILREEFSPVHVVRNLPDWTQPAADQSGQHTDRIRRELNIPENRTILLSQGGVQRGRGALVCIDALAHLPECELVFLGDGPMRDDVRLHAEVCGRAERVHLLPAVPSEELPQWTSSADIGLCVIEDLGQSYYLSLPNKLFEYIAAGVPVVGSDFPEIGAVLRDTGAGITVDPSNAGSVAGGVRRILDEPGLRERIQAGCRAAAREYRWEGEKEVFMNILRGALSDPG